MTEGNPRSSLSGTKSIAWCPTTIMLPLSDRAVIDAVMRAAARSAAAVHGEMKRGVNSLATITCVAPFLGLLITVEGIYGSFVGCGGEKWTCLAAMVDRLSNAIARGALGLLVGIVSFWCYQYLQSRLEYLDIEMKDMTLELAHALAAPTFRRRQVQ